jgi:nucleotide-binding universal stress UspA family protein
LHAIELAKKYQAKLHILHIPHSSYTYLRHIVNEHVPDGSESSETFFDDDVEERAREALEKAYKEKLGDFKDYLLVVKIGAPDVEIVRYARRNDIDVIVMGALGKSEADRIEHGSTVANVSKYAHCHVVAIRNPQKRFTLPGEMY